MSQQCLQVKPHHLFHPTYARIRNELVRVDALAVHMTFQGLDGRFESDLVAVLEAIGQGRNYPAADTFPPGLSFYAIPAIPYAN